MWKINADTHRQELEQAARLAASESHPQPTPTTFSPKRPLKIYYGSLHDILSYPCEDGDLALVAAASVSLHGDAHGQHVENVHLKTWDSEKDFFERLYESVGGYRERLLGKAEEFLNGTGAVSERTLVMIR